MKFYFLLLSTAIICKLYAQVRPDHIVIIILENKPDTKIEGNSDAVYINSLIDQEHTAMMTNSFGLTHPSQPNYIMMYSGSNQGVTTNDLPDNLPFTTPNLGASLVQKDFSFTGFCDGLPSVGYQGETSGDYKRKHNPWANWQGNGLNQVSPNSNQPYTSFPTDYNSLPTVCFVVPDQQHDMHDGTIKEGDTWVKENLSNYADWCKTHNSLFILTFDEDDGSNNNGILTLLIGEHIKGGRYSQKITHYNVLRTLEELYNLPYAGASKDSAAIKDIWDEIAPCNGGYLLVAGTTGSSYQWQLDDGTGFADIDDDNHFSGTKTYNLNLNDIPTDWYGYRFRCIIAGKASTPVTLKFATHFTAADDDHWENMLNWTCGLPDSNTDAFIDKGNAVLNSNQSVRSLKLKPGSGISVNAGMALTVSK